MFSGHTYEPAQDGERLSRQLERVKDLMRDGQWRSLGTISAAVHGSEASVSARLRDLRRPRFGGYTVDRRRVDGGNGLHEYRVLPRDGYANTTSSESVSSAGQTELFAPPSHMPERVR